ncbi:glycosyltransferase [Paenibacillus sp. YYML68]|uniref:glycosyltransferase n=1 Tax=Paenibacillus sp. YYML68 TaxID=2909250 RepID=UPI002493AC6B|nr:glycosyltransferase [Paenibacillus sp. YYML68]
MYPKVSIIIPFYNDPYISQALTSAVNQTYPNLEIIVIDDGSTQHTELIEPFRSRVHYIGKSNGGTASALNHGIRITSGDYIAWLSSDDMFYPHKLTAQLQYMLRVQAAICFTSFDYIDQHGRVTQAHAGVRFPGYAAFVRSLMYSNPINGCTVVARRDLLQQAGLFNEALRYTQDYDLWIRIVLCGIPFVYHDLPLTQYRWHNGMGTMRHKPAIEQEIQLVRSTYGHLLDSYARQLGG